MSFQHQLRNLHDIFRSFDRTGTGFINYGDFKKLVNQLSISLNESQFKELFETIEKDDKVCLQKVIG